MASVALVLLVVAPACAGGDDAEPTPLPTLEVAATPTPGTGPVEVVLGEWSVLPDPESVAAGELDFEIRNDGREIHELVVIDTDLDAGELPTTSDGAIDEAKIDVVSEAEDIAADTSDELTVELEVGTYILACNIVDQADDGSTRAHYKLGMRTGFTVS